MKRRVLGLLVWTQLAVVSLSGAGYLPDWAFVATGALMIAGLLYFTHMQKSRKWRYRRIEREEQRLKEASDSALSAAVWKYAEAFNQIARRGSASGYDAEEVVRQFMRDAGPVLNYSKAGMEQARREKKYIDEELENKPRG